MDKCIALMEGEGENKERREEIEREMNKKYRKESET